MPASWYARHLYVIGKKDEIPSMTLKADVVSVGSSRKSPISGNRQTAGSGMLSSCRVPDGHCCSGSGPFDVD
jgi:hypothetical protein